MDHKLNRVVGKLCSVLIVVSPLITLMMDQVRSLRRRKVKAALITCGGGVDRELLTSEADLADCSLLYCSPEALVKPQWGEILEKQVISGRIVAVLVDSAHCKVR